MTIAAGAAIGFAQRKGWLAALKQRLPGNIPPSAAVGAALFAYTMMSRRANPALEAGADAALTVAAFQLASGGASSVSGAQGAQAQRLLDESLASLRAIASGYGVSGSAPGTSDPSSDPLDTGASE